MIERVTRDPAPAQRSSRPAQAKGSTPSADLALKLDDDAPTLVPEGEYLAVFVRAHKRRLYGRHIVELVFTLLEDGQGSPVPEGVNLSMFCNLGPEGQVRRGSKLMQAWMLVAGRRPSRLRVSSDVFRHRLVRCVVRTVTTDQAQRRRTDLDAYSVIDRLVACGARVRP